MKNKLIYLPILLIVMLAFTSFGNKKTASQANAFVQLLQNSPSKVENAQGNVIPANQLIVERKWEGNICKTTVRNIGKAPLHPANIILFDIAKHGLNPKSPVYGEGFQMLDQKGGTLDSLVNIGPLPDPKHYRIPNLHGLTTAYGVLAISPKSDEHMLLGFTSCKRFIGRISYDAHQLLVSFDTEGLELKPGESWQMEDFMVLNGNDCGELFGRLADEIEKNHPPRKTKTIPTGWCSWYCYGPAVTHPIIEENLNGFSKYFLN